MILKDDTVIISESEFDTPEKFANLIIETIEKIISPKLKKFLGKKSNRQMLLEKYGEKAFLIPDELKFPVVNEKGKYDCGLIYAARIRAKQYAGKKPGYLEVFKKAEQLYRENKCEKKLKIHINDWEENNKMDLDVFVEMISHNIYFEIEDFDQLSDNEL